ncbi:MAG TPA: gas vesicle protein GvpO [Segeticoccus sp.]|nr:gas vesicle protein GvpO [Segeticoccus sp.]
MADQHASDDDDQTQDQDNREQDDQDQDSPDRDRDDQDQGQDAQEQGQRSSGSDRRPDRRVSLTSVAEHALTRLTTLTGREPEGVTSIEPIDEGWKVSIEVIESRRIPDSSDILGLYEVELDESGRMTGYRRVRRYARGRTGDD